nr:hypothetical protein [Tanacetum cinerariifolium]
MYTTMLCEWRLREKGADSNPYHNYHKFLDNDDEVLDDVSEDEWLQESLRKLPRFSQCGVSEDEFESKYGSDSNNSDFVVDEENLIHDEVNEVFQFEEDIYFENFDSGTDS